MSLQDFWNDDFRPLKHAGDVINKRLREDESGINNTEPASGKKRGEIYEEGGHFFRHAETIPLPDIVQERRETFKYHTKLGIQKGQYAYATVDFTVFVWKLRSEQVVSFEVPSRQTIKAVAVVPPRRGKLSCTF